MIQVRSVSKSFGNIEAVRDMSFSINKGEIFGILGPNGAGKSTIVNILNTLVKPDNGDVIIDGVNINNDGDTIKLIMGVVPQEIALYEELSAYENLMFWGGLYDIPKQVLVNNVNRTLEIVDLVNRKNDRIKTFSGGMKRRINIACSLLHNPRILVLDEPTVGVDPQNRNHIFEVIERLHNDGMTIIYTTHYLEEAERFCDKIAIIDVGRIIALGTLKELRKISDAKDLLTIKLADFNDSTLSIILTANPLIRFDSTTKTLEIDCENISNEISKMTNLIQDAGGVIERIYTRGTNLESIYLKLTGKELRD
ncbi:MAG: ABC transporter ATP-binding protein [Bacteroidales bacterium]|nr:ABC transporter ATP-binding protein [Bacteroidales bacterium]MBK7628819.1 ABC transporter ATP-binding protein [Bacteroidales bacterium]